MEIRIRQAQPEDGASIAAIYEPYIRDTVITFEEKPVTADEMSQRIAQTLPRYPFLVAEDVGQVIGYAYGGPHQARASYRWSVNVAVYIAGTHHRRGIGSTLYGQLLRLLAAQNLVTAIAGITMPNAASIRLHESVGFKPIALYHNIGFKLGAWRDVGWWERALIDPPPITPAEPTPWTDMPAFSPVNFNL